MAARFRSCIVLCSLALLCGCEPGGPFGAQSEPATHDALHPNQGVPPLTLPQSSPSLAPTPVVTPTFPQQATGVPQ